MMSKKRGSPLGVTLVELMIVIALIGLLAAIATPTVRRTQERAGARALGAQIAQDLRTARNQAMSRGEALWVVINAGAGDGVDRGSLQVLRSNLRCDDGTPGTGPCANNAEPRRARNCRQDKTLDTANPVLETVFDGFSGSAELAGTSPAVAMICFNPDGRVLDAEGNVISGGAGTCDGENLVIFTARADADNSAVTNAVNCTATADDRDLIDVYRVSVPFNGSIMMDQ